MIELFLACALALPALPQSSDKIFDQLVEMFERENPGKTLVLVHKDEWLLNREAVYTRLLFRDKWRLWVKRAA